VQIIILLVIHSLPLHFYLVPLRPKYFPQHIILEHPQPILFLHCCRQTLKLQFGTF
jgi:hypothetical protein